MDPITLGRVTTGIIRSSAARPSAADNAGGAEQAAQSFGKLLSQAVDTVNGAQQEADTAITRLAAGEPVDLHQVMLAMEKADLTMQLTTEVRGKLVEAYQEIMRMQV